MYIKDKLRTVNKAFITYEYLQVNNKHDIYIYRSLATKDSILRHLLPSYASNLLKDFPIAVSATEGSLDSKGSCVLIVHFVKRN